MNQHRPLLFWRVYLPAYLGFLLVLRLAKRLIPSLLSPSPVRVCMHVKRVPFLILCGAKKIFLHISKQTLWHLIFGINPAMNYVLCNYKTYSLYIGSFRNFGGVYTPCFGYFHNHLFIRKSIFNTKFLFNVGWISMYQGVFSCLT